MDLLLFLRGRTQLSLHFVVVGYLSLEGVEFASYETVYSCELALFLVEDYQLFASLYLLVCFLIRVL